MSSDTEVRKKLHLNKIPHDLAFEVSEVIINARIITGMTQERLAKKISTKQSAIARAENGTHLSTLSFLEKIAKAMGMRVEVLFIKKQ